MQALPTTHQLYKALVLHRTRRAKLTADATRVLARNNPTEDVLLAELDDAARRHYRAECAILAEWYVGTEDSR